MLWLRSLILLLLPVLVSAQQLTFATYQGGSDTDSTSAVVLDSSGILFLAGNTYSTDFPTASTGGGFVVKLDSTGHRLASILLPGTSISAMALDPLGNVLITGAFNSGALAASKGAYTTPTPTAFVAKLTAKLDTTALWTSTFAASPAALAVDASGVYVTGSASATFVTTTGVVQPAFRGGTTDAFVLKLSPDGTTALYATFLGGTAEDAAYALALGTAGEVYLTGATASGDFPLSAKPAQPKFGGRILYSPYWYGDAFVAKLDPKGATVLYSTYLGGAAVDEGNAITVDSAGNAYVGGSTESATFLAGPPQNTFQTAYAGPLPDPAFPFPAGDAFLAKFTSTGALAWYTYLGGATYDGASAIALDKSGNIYLAGNTDSSNFPKVGKPAPDCHIGGRPFLAEFDPNGAQLLLTAGLNGMGFDQVYAMALDTAHNVVYLAGDVESLVFFSTPGAAQPTYGGGNTDAFLARLDLGLQPSLAVACLLNAASFQAGNTASFPTGTVAPGEIVSIFGVGIGPDTAVGLQLTATGTVANTLGGTQVFFDGVPTAMLYAASGQINAVVPYGVKLPLTRVTLQHGSLSYGPISLPVAAAVPAIFTYDGSGAGQAAALNQDYSYNTVDTPAVRGQYITFYATGAGLMSSGNVDGGVTPLTLSADQLPVPQQVVTVTVRGVNAQVLYAGAAPGFVSGAMQINVIIPDTIDLGNHLPLFLNIGKFSSQFNISVAAK